MTAKILTVFNQKGGVGKTNLAMQIGGTLALRGFRVIVADLDKQSTASRWSSDATAEFPFPARVVSLSGHEEKFVVEVGKMAPDFDYILLDCPPSLTSKIPSVALSFSDFALVPVIPSPGEMHSTSGTKELLERAIAVNSNLQARAVINAAPRTGLARHIAAYLRKDSALPVLKTEISHLAAFAEAQSRGVTVHQIARAEKSAHQINAVVDEILAIVGGPASIAIDTDVDNASSSAPTWGQVASIANDTGASLHAEICRSLA